MHLQNHDNDDDDVDDEADEDDDDDDDDDDGERTRAHLKATLEAHTGMAIQRVHTTDNCHSDNYKDAYGFVTMWTQAESKSSSRVPDL